MRCLVIGGSGFLGTAIVDELVRRGDTVLTLDRSGGPPISGAMAAIQGDIRDYDHVRTVVFAMDEVYHVAGMLGTSELNQQIIHAVQVNVVGAVNVFSACVDAGVSKVFYPSKPNPWLNTYTVTKLASEQFAGLFDEQSADTSFVRMRWFNAYGPGQHTYPVRKIIPTFCLCARFGLPLPIFGTGHNVVDMCFSADIARWSVEATRQGLSGQVYDLGTGVPRSVIDVAETVNRIADNTAGLAFVPMRVGETENTKCVADLQPLRDTLQARGIDLEMTDWDASIEATYRHYADMPEGPARIALRHHGLI